MRKLFTNDSLCVCLSRNSDGKLALDVQSIFADSRRKDRLHINEKSMASYVEQFWNDIKKVSGKIQSVLVGFHGVDYYDSLTDVYSVPCFKVKRGFRKVTIGHNENGVIPKEWEISLRVEILPTSTVRPILAVIDATAGRFMDHAQLRKMTKSLRSVLQGKENTATYFV